MGLLARIQDVVQGTANLLIGVNNRLSTALTAINANPPTYRADDLTRDVTQTALDTLQLGLRFWRPLGDPVLPTLVITSPFSAIPGTPNGDVALMIPVPLGAVSVATPLAFIGDPGGANPPAAAIASLAPSAGFPTFLDPLRQSMRHQVAVPANQPRGVYQGLILINGVNSPPIATVVARII